MKKVAQRNILLILLLSTLSISGFKFIRPWTMDQEKAASNLIREFQDAFQYFASVNHEGKGTVYMFKLQNFFKSQRSRHFYDLFEEYNPNSTDLEDYLFTIKNQYKCNLTVEFEPLDLPKQEIFNGKKYARYILKKRIDFHNKSKEVTNIIMVEMDSEQPKIDVIGLPEHFPDGGCASITKNADRYFNDNNYTKARELYQARVLCEEDKYAHDQIIICNNLINQQSQVKQLSTRAEKLLNNKQYEDAQHVLENLMIVDPENIYAREKMSLVHEKLSADKNFQLLLNQAEKLKTEGQLAKALATYQKAQIINDDESMHSKIEELKSRIAQSNPALLKAKADKLFSSGKFNEAKVIYQEAYIQNPTKDLQKMINHCDNEINFDIYSKQAQQLYQEEKFRKAKEMVQLANQYKPDNKSNNSLLTSIDNEINFNKYLELGDYFMTEAKLYEQARQHYAMALQFHPDDQKTEQKMHLASKLYKEQLNTPESVRSRVNTAVRLYNRKKFDQSFKILYQVEESGMLAPGHYYMLGETAVTNRKNIHKKMGWNKKQGIAIGAYYLAKAIDNQESRFSILALKRYCDLRAKTIQTLQLNSFNCEELYENSEILFDIDKQ